MVTRKYTRYAWKAVAVVDPVEPAKVLARINEELPQYAFKTVLTTHHHRDHSGGNAELSVSKPGLEFYGGDDRIPSLNVMLRDGDEFMIGNINAKAIKTIGHTMGSISYYLQDGDNDRAVFTGDTLFIGGCGRLFEGTAADMYDSLTNRLGSLPKDTKVYVGHEYTYKNYKFALTVDSENELLKQKTLEAQNQKITVPSTIEQELLTNPFMRVGEPALKKATGESDPVRVLAAIRAMKDKF
ncbi:Cytoplasmic glyoxalase II [Spiromyces aspiralis]|uniref:Cytoplasmic glyoxalase II n=1 Tax=Spiromyces aspiralis TaxID=68401 RepID=A0ACC1HGM4_9FUNG|nr:Cytoplasmic glyoxalase II [Spiromyces aspiralis]